MRLLAAVAAVLAGTLPTASGSALRAHLTEKQSALTEGRGHRAGRTVTRAAIHTAQALRSPRPSVSALSTVRLTLSFLCIHQYEGAWNAATGNGYYGGLQMDDAFERAYGRAWLTRYGHANRWPAAVQIAVAIRAFHSGRGFGPWPQTRKRCGL